MIERYWTLRWSLLAFLASVLTPSLLAWKVVLPVARADAFSLRRSGELLDRLDSLGVAAISIAPPLRSRPNEWLATDLAQDSLRLLRAPLSLERNGDSLSLLIEGSFPLLHRWVSRWEVEHPECSLQRFSIRSDSLSNRQVDAQITMWCPDMGRRP